MLFRINYTDIVEYMELLMKNSIIIKSDFPCAYLINGKVFDEERLELDDECVYYFTVLPLDAVFLPYTVKVVGCAPVSNQRLCARVVVDNRTFLLFTKRYNYVFSPSAFEEDNRLSCLLGLIKQRRFAEARQRLTPSLSSAVSDETLVAFFEKFEFAVAIGGTEFLLASSSGNGSIVNVVEKDHLIDDIK